MTDRRSTVRATRRAAAVIAAATVVLAQLLVIWHHTAIRHRWCAQHQDVCEDRGRAAPVAAVHSERDALAFGTGGDVGSDGDHAEGCGLHGISLTSTWSAPPPVVASTTLAGRELRFVDSVAPAATRALLRFAPKTSPPAA